MPDLGRPVLAVSKAVHNLVKVGREMVQTTDDKVMQQVMLIKSHRLWEKNSEPLPG